MVTPSAGSVVLVRFPFSDLSRSKLRPAVVLADAGRGDWIPCQVTSNPYSDSKAVTISDEDFRAGSLRRTSYARPGKLFTASQDLLAAQVGNLKDKSYNRLIEAVVVLLRSNVSDSEPSSP